MASEIRTVRKRPVEVQAVLWTGDNINTIWDWAGADKVYGPTEKNPTSLIISTLEGDMLALLGDWIVRGVFGEFYPCKPDVFDATYVDITDVLGGER